MTEDAGDDGWIVRRRGSSAVEETLFALADGILGVRASLEERRSKTSGVYMVSAFEQTPIHHHERLPGFAEWTDTRVPIADGMRLEVVVGGIVLGDPQTSLEDCNWELDLRSGVSTRTSTWSTPAGRLQVCAKRVMPCPSGATIALRFVIKSLDFQGIVAITSLLDVSNRNARAGEDPRIGVDLAGGGLHLIDSGMRDGIRFCVQKTARSGKWVASAQAHRPTLTNSSDGDHLHRILRPGDEVSLEKFVAYSTGDGKFDGSGVSEVCSRASTSAASGFSGHVASRTAELDAQWRTSDVRILGDDAADRALRFNLFHLLQSASLHPRYSTAAKGLTGEGYEGHAFWDTEAFVLPALVFTAPRLARVALEARIAQLACARRHARLLNHNRGALFPWRTIAGNECSSHYPSGSAQYHINAAIAQAVELYVTATDDQTILLDGAAELLWETARIWLDVGTYSPAYEGKFCIFGVTGPDEYSALVDNNYYTNRMAALHLRYAASTYFDLKERYPHASAPLFARLKLDTAEVTQWKEAADAMYLPYDEALGVDAQDERFLAKPRLKIPSCDGSPLLLNLHPLTLYRHQISKQADLILAMVFAGGDVPLDRLRRNLAYYEAVTTHDSTLSPCAYSIVSSMAGLPDRALDYFRKTVHVDIDDLHGNVSHGSHMAALAGSVMAVQWGFSGLTWRGGTLGFRPSLPASWKGVSLRIRWRGRLIEANFDHSKTTYRLLEGPPVEVHHCGEAFLLGGTVERALSRAADCIA